MQTVDLSNFQVQPAETSKAYDRRVREDFFVKYCQGKIIDIGAGRDPLMNGVDIWDQMYGDGDATYMHGVPDATYDTVYTSHIIEHVVFAEEAIRNWFRILKPGGHLIIFGPERDLYEKKQLLPSNWNLDHKTYWKLTTTEPPNTFSIIQTIANALLPLVSMQPASTHYYTHAQDLTRYGGGGLPSGPHFKFEYAKLCDEGWQSRPVYEHSVGEYSFEVVIKKL